MPHILVDDDESKIRLLLRRCFEEEGYRVTSDLLEERPDTTAVLAANDRLALGAIDAIREVGRSCPDDVSVVAVSLKKKRDRFSPPLTTVHISQNNLGAMAANLLLETIADPGRPAETHLAPPELVIRGSTAPARN